MSIKDNQYDVHKWISQFKVGYYKPLEIMTQMMEEVGELSRELNNRFGPRIKKSPEDTADIEGEICDIIFALICLANSQKIDLDEAWKNHMDKLDNRDKDRFERKD
ncbi:MAG: nucleotide pyrophosphohydrolase [archaeon]